MSVSHKQQPTSHSSVEVVLEGSDVYSSELNDVTTSTDCHVILVVECLVRKNHRVEIGHAYASLTADDNHSEA